MNRYNSELEKIREQLENRVEERTSNLNEANKLLQSTNIALAEEIKEHLNTTNQLRGSEAYITDILRSMPLMLIGLDDQNRITQWNRQAENISGIDAKHALGNNLWECYQEIPLTQQNVDRSRNDRKAVSLKYSQREQYHFNILVYPLHNQLETGVVILIDNVTEQVNNNNLLIQRDKMSSMGEMAAVMAHDINLPLSASLKDLQVVRQALAEQSRIVRLPLNKIGSINKINRAFSDLEQKFGRPPTPEEIAESLDMTIEEVKQSIKNSGRHLSMDAPLKDSEDSNNMYEVMSSDSSPKPDKTLMNESLRREIERSLSTLTPREADVIRLYFGLSGKHPMTLEEIGEKFDLTRERVRQIKEKSIRRLKHTSRSKLLKAYLG